MKAANRTEFIDAAILRAARNAAGASATRGNGKGAAKAGRDFLGKLQIKRFSVRTSHEFQEELNGATKQLQNRFPNSNWGLARKLINIFLRDVLYNKYLCYEFHFDAIENFLEIPLDSITAEELRQRTSDCAKRPCSWKGVKH